MQAESSFSQQKQAWPMLILSTGDVPPCYPLCTYTWYLFKTWNAYFNACCICLKSHLIPRHSKQYSVIMYGFFYISLAKLHHLLFFWYFLSISEDSHGKKLLLEATCHLDVISNFSKSIVHIQLDRLTCTHRQAGRHLIFLLIYWFILYYLFMYVFIYLQKKKKSLFSISPAAAGSTNAVMIYLISIICNKYAQVLVMRANWNQKAQSTWWMLSCLVLF